MFLGSACPIGAINGDADPIPGEGPWCQNATDECSSCDAVEDPVVKFPFGKNKKKRKCNWVSKKGRNRAQKMCKRKTVGSKGKKTRVHKICPLTCGLKAGVGECKFLDN